jgi:threonine/homoserine/homoserine lactone efflux protein
VLGIHHFWIFVVAGIVLNITPGPDTFYILGRSISQGRAAGVLSALAIGTGCLFHMTLAAFGLSAILKTSPLAFQIIRYAGAAYLVFLGVRLLFARADESNGTTPQPAKLWVIYRQGVLTNILNPKVALFFLAFLPQFIDPAASGHIAGLLVLGAVFMINGTIYCVLLAWFAAAISGRLRDRLRLRGSLQRTTGALFIGLGAKLAVGA